jgi:hypothetical protein
VNVDDLDKEDLGIFRMGPCWWYLCLALILAQSGTIVDRSHMVSMRWGEKMKMSGKKSANRDSEWS